MADALALQEELIESIRRAPWDDAPRLAFADAVEGTDAERAEIIRVQCAYARADAHDEALYQRQRVLWSRGEARWRAAMPQAEGVSWPRAFTRGFFEGLSGVGFRALLPILDRALATAPVQGLFIGGIPAEDATTLEDVRGLAAAPQLERFSSLRMQSRLGDPLLETLAASARVGNLRTLRLSRCRLTDLGVNALCRSTCLVALENLDLGFNAIGEGASALGEWRTCAQLHALDLRDNAVGGPGAQRLFRSPLLGGIQELILGWCEIGDLGAKAIAESPGLGQLHTLQLWCNDIGREGIEALCRSNKLASLRELALNGNALGDEGARLLAACPALSGLQRLSLDDTALGDEGARALLASPYLEGLRATIGSLHVMDNATTVAVEQELKKAFPCASVGVFYGDV